MQQQASLKQRIDELVVNRKWGEVEQLLAKQQKSNQLMNVLIDLYGHISLKDEEQYEQYLRLIVHQIDTNIDYHSYKPTVTAIITQLISHSSAKYALVIIRGMIAQMQLTVMGRFAILSNIYLFGGLFYGSSCADLLAVYDQLITTCIQVQSQLNLIKTEQTIDINWVLVESVSYLLGNINNDDRTIDRSRHDEVLVFYSKITTKLHNLAQSNENYQSIYNQIVGQPINQILLLFLHKHSIDITKQQLTLPFVKVITKWNINIPQLQYQSFALSNSSIIKLLLHTLSNQLNSDLNSMPEITHQDCMFIANSILYISNYLSQSAQKQDYSFLCNNAVSVQQWVQKVNIFLGAVNPKQQIYQQLNLHFLPLSFIPKHHKQRILSKLIQKHKNESFKCHLISQYRKLLTFNAPKYIWIRSTSILLEQLGGLQAKSSVDYIGHILSFVYYWKQVGNKLIQTNQFIHIDISTNKAIVGQKLSKLKHGLEDRLKLAAQQTNQQQRNEISVCLFRIDQLLSS